MENNKLKAILKKENPKYNRGDKINITGLENMKKAIVKNIYSRKLEDLTFNDLKMMGWDNPNKFVSKWIEKNGSFDNSKTIWVVVYEHMKEEVE